MRGGGSCSELGFQAHLPGAAQHRGWLPGDLGRRLSLPCLHPGERMQEGQRSNAGSPGTVFFQMPNEPCGQHVLCSKGQLQKAGDSANPQIAKPRARLPHQSPCATWTRNKRWAERGGTSPDRPGDRQQADPCSDGPLICRSVLSVPASSQAALLRLK